MGHAEGTEGCAVMPTISPTAAYRLLTHCRRKGDCLLWVGKSWSRAFRLYADKRKSPIEPSTAAWVLRHGPVPAGHEVVRTCGDYRCITHLAAVTHAMAKHAMGLTRLTPTQVRQLRRAKASPGIRGVGVLALARRFGVSQSAANQARHRATYRWVT